MPAYGGNLSPDELNALIAFSEQQAAGSGRRAVSGNNSTMTSHNIGQFAPLSPLVLFFTIAVRHAMIAPLYPLNRSLPSSAV